MIQSKLGNGNGLEDWDANAADSGIESEVLHDVSPGGNRFMEYRLATLPNGQKRVVFLRPNSTFTLPIFTDSVTGKVCTILVEELRAGSARHDLQFPAESNDKPGEGLANTIARSVGEEAGIESSWIQGTEQIPTGLGRNGASPGGTNEQLDYFTVKIDLPEDKSIWDLDGQERGEESGGEEIVTHVVPFDARIGHLLNSVGEKMALPHALRQIGADVNEVLDEMATPSVEGETWQEIVTELKTELRELQAEVAANPKPKKKRGWFRKD